MDINWSNLATDIQISVQTETDIKRYTFDIFLALFYKFYPTFFSVIGRLLTVFIRLSVYWFKMNGRREITGT